jgi:hypothetical protein
MDDYNMSARMPETWHGMSNSNMGAAQKAQRMGHQVCDDSFKAHRQCLSENLGKYHSLHASFSNKTNMSRNLCDNLHNRMKSVALSIKKNEHSLAALEHANRAKEAPLALCKYRIDARHKRPQREHIRDPFEYALEEEESTLQSAQADLKVQMERTHRSIQELVDCLKELQHDFDVKSHALQIDEQCMRSTHKAWHKGSTPRSPVPPATTVAFQSTNTGNEDLRCKESVDRTSLAKDKEAEAHQLREYNMQLIEHCQHACDMAKARTERAMQERISENQAMRKRLEGEVRETNAKIEKVKSTILDTKLQIKSLADPKQLNDTRDTWRKQRAYREQILDPVSTQMVEHKMHLIKTTEALVQRRREEKQALAELEKSKKQLQADLADKMKACQIDLDCLSHTVVHQGGRALKSLNTPRFTRALQVDPNFVPTLTRAQK